MDSLTKQCLEQLKTVQENHCESISNIRSEAEKCLIKDYLVDHHTDTTPKKRDIVVPSVASIEDMRTPSFENLKEEENNSVNRSKLGFSEGKTQQQVASIAFSPNRTPFADVN
ncbi:ATP binding microtubule motor family protein [Corchorus olitorius]|uniref:ATP binding microtubule motor family protein n=1 Tax=Corchorus olitorius TaxID=93759 RepID=A0A1R3JQE7_9ROSI|nr:ATP binding microtubule motor family protein [Corchorus olitorius]